jgi:hypothetical protein
MIPPPLPPGIQTTILSHLLPPNIPLPQQLLSKSLLQRHLYLPPSPDDIDAWLNPAPTPGIAELLERLTGTGWRVSSVDYGFDGEHYLARVKVVEDGRQAGEGEEVDVVFEFEAGGERDEADQSSGGQEGRGWTYHSVHNGRSGSAISNINWTTDVQNINTIEEHSGESEEVNGLGSGEENNDAPAGYWAGFSPPASPRMNADGDTLPQGEDDYWASYGKSFTPGGVTPAVQQSPAISRTQTRENVPRASSTLTTNTDTKPSPAPTGEKDGLLRSRMEMKIASLLRKLWVSHLPSSDPELRALTFLSLARAIQQPSDTTRIPIGGAGDTEGTKGKMEVLYEVYEVIEDGDKDGFMRLVEKSLTSPGSMGGFGVASRQDSSAQLNYWE